MCCLGVGWSIVWLYNHVIFYLLHRSQQGVCLHACVGKVKPTVFDMTLSWESESGLMPRWNTVLKRRPRLFPSHISCSLFMVFTHTINCNLDWRQFEDHCCVCWLWCLSSSHHVCPLYAAWCGAFAAKQISICDKKLLDKKSSRLWNILPEISWNNPDLASRWPCALGWNKMKPVYCVGIFQMFSFSSSFFCKKRKQKQTKKHDTFKPINFSSWYVLCSVSFWTHESHLPNI